MDFPADPKAANIPDEYMYGPALLVAPVSEQGATSRSAYLPAGTDWYNYWTKERYHGGQSISVNAPIDTLPLFVRAGSILPLGSPVENAERKQVIAKIQVWPGVDTDFALYQDDGETYAYEKTGGEVTKLHWDEQAQRLTHSGAAAWTQPDSELLEVIHGAAAPTATLSTEAGGERAMR
jgi:alpha-glucosidase (family GH31 glycosyl hydrolase)